MSLDCDQSMMVAQTRIVNALQARLEELAPAASLAEIAAALDAVVGTLSSMRSRPGRASHMTPHDHTTLVPGCYRCELGRDEALAAEHDEACALTFPGHAK